MKHEKIAQDQEAPIQVMDEDARWELALREKIEAEKREEKRM